MSQHTFEQTMYPNNTIHALVACVLLVLALPARATEPSEKAYVALEGEGKIAVLDTRTRQVIRQIDLTETVAGRSVMRAPHNVQVAPNGQSVWLTANVHGHHGHEQATHEERAPALDQVIVIEPASDTVVRRIDVAPMAHLSHVVIAPDGRTVYVNAQNQHRIYRIDAGSFRIQGFTGVSGQGPHGIRLSPDGSRAYLAMLEGRNLGILDAQTGGMTHIPVGGAAVQTAITADGRIAMASVYDTKRLAVYEVANRHLAFIDLPGDARGPVQLYPTPDSRYVYLADQGVYFDQPAGHTCYKIDLSSRQVVKAITAGEAPHGVVVSADGTAVYITNLLSDDVSVIDTRTDREVARIPVGKGPNGISLWSAAFGGTP